MRSRHYQKRAQWEVDRSIPIGTIVTIVIQTAVIVWWTAQLSTRVEYVERTVVQLSQAPDRLTKLETKFESIIDDVKEIKSVVKRLIPQSARK